MRWVKRGRVFAVSGEHGWMRSHAQIPTVLPLDDRLRVYFATRPEPGLSLTGMVDLDATDPSRIIEVHPEPVLDVGPPGSFDAHGIMPQWVCENGGEVWLYYGGWSRRVDIPYSNWTGLAISDDGGLTFRKAFAGPVLDRTRDEIFSATGCTMLREGGDWHAWYAGGTQWVELDGKLEEVYVIKYAHSQDGISWERENRQLLPSLVDPEPTHRPSVVEIDGTYHMWFCHRRVRDFRGGAGSYRIGYARSLDAREWERDDSLAGTDVSPEGWDSEMMAYPYVVKVGDRVLMFYNGNGFGATGFGVAELVEPS